MAGLLRQVIDRLNKGNELWAGIACRSQSKDAWLADRLLSTAQVLGKSKPIVTVRANAAKSWINARIEHVFAHQKN